MIRALTLAGLLVAFAGCVADVKLRHPSTGKVAICEGGYCPGVMCLPAQQRQMRCIDDFQRQGYERAME
jgi:hypothetical protein